MPNKLLFIVIGGLFLFAAAPLVLGQSVEELRATIDKKNSELEAIQKEIDGYQKEIETTGKEADSLKKVLAQLESNRKKLLAEIKGTETKISKANTNIKKLDVEIVDKKTRLTRSVGALGASMRDVNELESTNLVEMVLSQKNFSDVWDDLENLNTVQEDLYSYIGEVKKLKEGLESDKKEKEDEKKRLTSLKNGLSDQKKVVEVNQTEKDRLLKETKNKESEYQRLLLDRLAKKNALERELYDYESKLQITLDPTKLPPARAGVLSWPLDKVKITQYFGATAFAAANPRVYNGSGHNGVDLSASPGTPIKAAGQGRVVDTGNTDTACYGVSYGKWVLIEHNNGLSTLYAHLDLIKASPGQEVSLGDVIGYSGNTGYSTGPHLHFAVFATQAVRVAGPTEYKSKVCKTYLKLPLSPLNGYLNPLSYL